ncbi:MAG: DUF1559 domain-containing protein [Planctomycetaceae bacterium]|nr:DUF1559 domain-containing protein [Planctomycetaceae bacterium]
MKRLFLLCLVASSLGLGTVIAFNRPPETQKTSYQPIVSQSLEEILPADPFLYLNWDGFKLHADEWKETVAYESLVESGLTPALLKVIQSLSVLGGPRAQEAVDMVLNQGLQRGFSTCVVLQPTEGMPPLPALYLGLREGDEYLPLISELMVEGYRDQVQQGEVNGVSYQRVLIPDSPGVSLGLWKQGGHLLMTIGLDVEKNIATVSSPDSKHLSQSSQWTAMSSAEDFQVCSTVWFDFSMLADTYGPMPLPIPTADGNPLTVANVLEQVGLANLKTISSKSGLQGEALWSESEIVAPGERTGLLSGLTGTPMTLDDIPPMPESSGYFYVGQSDWSGAWQSALDLYESVSKLAPPGSVPPAESGKELLGNLLGFDIQADLLATLGKRYAVFIDNSQASFMLPSLGMIFEVQDSQNLLTTMALCVDKIRELAPPNAVTVQITEKQGRPFGILNIANGMFSISIAQDQDWLVVGLSPQIVEATLLRIDGKLPTWKPTEEWLASFEKLPSEFVSISTLDVRQGYQAIASVLPALLGFGQGMLKQASQFGGGPEVPMNVSVADFPPAALVTQKLFPSIGVATVSEKGMKWTSRSSAPGVSASNAGSLAAAPVLVALLLPAVQQARTAARRSQSKNNLKQLGLAIHNYHDTYQKLPTGTGASNPQSQEAQLKLKPEERLSFFAQLLPYYDQANIYNNLDHSQGWKAKANVQWTSPDIETLLNPGWPKPRGEFGVTHYVGIAGIGKDAPMLKLPHKRAGMFGYERETRFRDVRDGLSNTMMMTEASAPFGPWAQGGPSTLRSLTQKPYINGPDGIGGPYTGGLNVLMGDGSVRFVSENIDPSVFEAMSTIAGGEAIGNIP